MISLDKNVEPILGSKKDGHKEHSADIQRESELSGQTESKNSSTQVQNSDSVKRFFQKIFNVKSESVLISLDENGEPVLDSKKDINSDKKLDKSQDSSENFYVTDNRKFFKEEKIIRELSSRVGRPTTIKADFNKISTGNGDISRFQEDSSLNTDSTENLKSQEKSPKDKSVVLLTGNPAAAKGSSMEQALLNNVDSAGLVFDAPQNKFSSAEKRVAQAVNAGHTVTIIQIYNDPLTSWENALKRGISKGRFLPLKYFIDDAYERSLEKVFNIETELKPKHGG